MLTAILSIAVALFAAPLVGGLITGIDRKVTARMQGRLGPPLFQPFYDVAKLLGKQAIVVNKMQIMYVYLHLAFMMLVLVLLALGQDMLLVLFVHAFSTVALVMGGMCVRSPYSRIGSQRKIIQMLAYEPILVLMVVGMYLNNNHSFMAGDLMSAAMAGKSAPMLLSLPLIFIAFLMAVAIKMEKSPFDLAGSHHAHQEIVKGITIEYSGPYLAIIEIAHFYEVALLFTVIAIFWAPNLIIGGVIASVCFTGLAVLDNMAARLTIPWMLRIMWTVALGLAMVNILWMYA